MKRILFNFALLTTGSLLLANTVACSSSGASSLEEEVDGENGATGPSGSLSGNGSSDGEAGPGGSSGTPGSGPGLSGTCGSKPENKVIGLGGIDLVLGATPMSKRPDTPEKEGVPLTIDRFRVKPYEVLAGEFIRVLGNHASMLSALQESGAALGKSPVRWFDEPIGSAPALYAALRVAFKGCVAYAATTPAFATQPTLATAQTECTKLQLKAWNRAPTAAEVTSCVNVAMDNTAFAAATPAITDAKAKWAYACSSVLTSASFLSF